MTTNPPGPSLAGVPREFASAIDLSPGTEGISLSILRPSGKARFVDQIIDVITQGEFIPSNTSITVVQRDGMRVVVKATR
jgi:membrane-bound serine protease (ClpP class)